METEGDEVTSRQLRRLEKDLLLIQRTRSELTSKVRRCFLGRGLELSLPPTMTQDKDGPGTEMAKKKKKPVGNYCRSGIS